MFSEHHLLLSRLEKVADGLLFRVASVTVLAETPAPYHPADEVERADEVDAACSLIATALAEGGLQTSDVAFRVHMNLAPLVLWRIRDAQRHLREAPLVWDATTDLQTGLRLLLVDSWHTYGEKYWLERHVQTKPPHVEAELAIAGR